jgi:hypothetical protein
VGARTYAANLQNVGLVALETEVLLDAYHRVGDWSDVRRLAVEENLLGKRSTTTVRHILKVVARRYIKGPEWLPSLPIAATFFAHAAISSRAKTQVAFLYTVAEDRLVQDCLDALVLRLLGGASGGFVHVDDVTDHLRQLSNVHPELGRWRPYLRRRWASGFLSLLRDVGFLGPAPSAQLSDPVILPEAFGFVFPWLVDHTGGARTALNHQALAWWAVDPDEKRTLLAAGQERGWWRYAAAGSMIEFEPIATAGPAA